MGRVSAKRTKQRASTLFLATTTAVSALSGIVQGQTIASWLNPVDGNWTDASKWSTNPLYPDFNSSPLREFAVTVGASGNPYTITLTNDSIQLSQLDITAPDVRVNAKSNSSLDVVGNLSLNNSSITLGGAQMSFGTGSGGGPSAVSGAGEFVFQSGGTNYIGGNTLTIGSGITIRTDTGDGNLSALNYLGMIRSTGAFRTIRLTGGTNSGSIIGDTGGSLFLKSISSSGTVSMTGGGTLTLDGAWTNSGTISATNSAVVFAGTLSHAQLDSVKLNNSAILLRADLANTGTTLMLDNSTGTFNLVGGGRITGGTISGSSGVNLQVGSYESAFSLPILDGVILGTNVVGGLAGNAVTIENGLTLLNVSVSSTALAFGANPALSGSGTVVGGGLNVSSGTLMIGSGITVQGNVSLNSPSAKAVNFGTIVSASPAGTINIVLTTNANQISVQPGTNAYVALEQNSGTASVSAGSLMINGLPWTNTGTVAATNGATLRLAGSFSNSGFVTATDSLLSLGTWSNSGTIIANNSTIELGGSFTTAAMAAINRTNSAVKITGTLNNSGATLNLNAADGSFLVAGSVVGGTIKSVDGSQVLGVAGSLSTLTLDADFSIVPSPGTTIFSANSVVNHATINVPAKTRLFQASIQNTGTIMIPGGRAELTGDWSNLGTITLNGGTLVLSLNSGSINNAGVISGDGTILVGGTPWQWSDLGTLNRTGGLLSLQGTLNNEGKTLLVDNIGTWALTGPVGGGTITGGTISSSTGGTLEIGSSQASLGKGGTLDGVTVDVDLRVTPSSTLVVQNGLKILNGHQVILANGSGQSYSLVLSGTQAITGHGAIVFNRTGLPLSDWLAPLSGTTTIGPDITVRTGVGAGTVGASGNALINQGLISAQTAGRTIRIAGTFENQGRVEALNGATLVLPSTVVNFNGGTLSGGTWVIGTNSTIAFGAGTIITNNANIIYDGPRPYAFAEMNGFRTNLGVLSLKNHAVFHMVNPLTNAGTINVDSLSTLLMDAPIDNSHGLIDLNNKMEVHYSSESPFAELVSEIGTQIISSAAMANPNLGIGSADYPYFVLLQLTTLGDATLDGAVNYTDLVALSQNYQASSLVGAGWTGGDFNYDGAVNLTDLYALGYQYTDPLHPLPQALESLGLPLIEVPEPGLALLLAGAAWPLFGRAHSRLQRPRKRRRAIK
jgi:hypothetical protein